MKRLPIRRAGMNPRVLIRERTVFQPQDMRPPRTQRRFHTLDRVQSRETQPPVEHVERPKLFKCRSRDERVEILLMNERETIRHQPIIMTLAKQRLRTRGIRHDQASRFQQINKFSVGFRDFRRRSARRKIVGAPFFTADAVGSKFVFVHRLFFSGNALVPLIEKQRKILQDMSFLESWDDEPLLDVFALGLSERHHRDVQDLTVSTCHFSLGESVLRRVFHGKFRLEYKKRQEFLVLIRAYLFTHPNFKEE